MTDEPKAGENFPNSKTVHGSTSGYSKHKRENTPACKACLNAKFYYAQAYYQRTKDGQQGFDNAARKRARARALEDLRLLHTGEFQKLYRAQLEKRGLA